jgi:hypothetical protein
MRFARADLVLPLESAENALLEVLLSQFTLRRRRGARGVELEVAFDGTTPSTWNRLGREAVRRRTPRFERQAALYKEKLDRILLDGRAGRFRHDDPGFLFRWASAGALPIVNLGRKDYYCFFFRDVFPIGWNIANGATESRDELLNPLHALEREIGEELVVLDPVRERRLVLHPDKDALLAHPEPSRFRTRWREQYRGLDITRYGVNRLPLRWEDAPDRVIVRMGRQLRRLQNCFVNINAADFGIELDRIARIPLDDRLVLCDGEVAADRVLNRPVGLFEVSTLQRDLAGGRTAFLPDRFFHGGQAHPGDALSDFLNRDLLRDMRRWRPRRDIDRFARTSEADRLRLCPVTESIVRRHVQSGRPRIRPGRARHSPAASDR